MRPPPPTDVLDANEGERLSEVAPDELLRRRDFLHRLAAGAGAGAGLGLAAMVGPEALIAHAAAKERRRRVPNPRNLPIDTFVVVMMENRSFDHLLGWLPGADGRQAGLTYLDGAGQPHETAPLAPDFQGCGHPIPGHVWEQGRVQLNGGAADGWLLPGSGNDSYAIGYYTDADVPYLAATTRAGAVCDRYFASLLGSTNPNRSYMHAAQSYGDKLMLFDLPGDAEPQFPTPPGRPFRTTISHRLQQAGLDATTFHSDLNYAAMWGPAGERRSAPIAEYFARATRGTLPALSFVDPELLSTKEQAGLSNDQHPHGDIRTGEWFLHDVIHAFLGSPQWRRGALFLVYDEWGGFFDHVAPPSVPDARQSPDLDEDFGQMGFRVPAVVLSPYARRGEVVHTRFGHESILRLVEQRYGLRPLTVRDARANSIAAAFDFDARPRTEPPDLPTPARVVSEACETPA